MNLQELCRFSEIQRLSPANELKGLLGNIANWFNSLPECFDEETLKKELLKAIVDEDDIFDCSISLEDNTANFSLYNSKSKKLPLSNDEVAMFTKLASILPGNLNLISQHLDAGAPIEFFFYIKNDDDFKKFKDKTMQLLTGIMIDYDFDSNISDEGDRIVAIFVPYGILADISAVD